MDEFKCKKCNGTGWDPDSYATHADGTTKIYFVCEKCRGYGYLDWIENARGKKPETSPYKKFFVEI